MSMDTSAARWRKSTRSGGESGDCVEVAGLPGVIAVRDSKNPDGPILAFDAPAFGTMVSEIRTGGHDL